MGLPLALMRSICMPLGGYDNYVLDFPIQDNKLGTPDTIRLSAPYPKARTCPTGMVTGRVRKRLFVVTKGDSTLFEISYAGHPSYYKKSEATGYGI